MYARGLRRQELAEYKLANQKKIVDRELIFQPLLCDRSKSMVNQKREAFKKEKHRNKDLVSVANNITYSNNQFNSTQHRPNSDL